jgi:hypothetical protein
MGKEWDYSKGLPPKTIKEMKFAAKQQKIFDRQMRKVHRELNRKR